MQRKNASFAERIPAATTVAWWVALLATLALALTVGIANPVQAQTLPGGAGPSLTLLPEDEEEAGEGDDFEAEAEYDEECELSEDGDEEICEEVEGADATPPECLLSSAEATVSTNPARGTLRLAVRYTARSSAAVTVAVKLRGRKGSLSLGAEQERFKRTGVHRVTERLTAAQMARVLAAKSFTVGLAAVNTPRYCHDYLDRELTVKRAGGGGLTWSAPAARSGA